MVVCQFFLRGQCKFGDSCRNEHPRERHTSQPWTSGNSQAKTGPLFTSGAMSNDFTPQVDKPIWPLSSYGPAKYDPVLIANLDQSPEELRLLAVTAIQNGALNDYLKYESDKIMEAEQIYANARSNIMQAYDQAVKQYAAASDQSVTDTNATSTTSSAFGGTTSAFGQPSVFSALGKAPPAPSGNTVSAFGSTTAPTSVFGKSGFGQSAFGQTAAPASTSAFGQPAAPASTSAFGQPAAPASTSAFGQPAAPASTSAFGQPAQASSAFGQTSLTQSSFIKPASGAFGTAGGGAFGATPSGQSAFSNPSGGLASGSGGGFSAFAGQPSVFGAAANNSSAPSGGSAFGQSAFGNPPAAASSAFGAPAPAQGSTASAFGAPSAFGALAQPNQFGTTSAFGASAFAPSPNPTGYVFGPGGTGGPFSNNNQVASPFASQSQSQPTSAFAPAQQPQPPTQVIPQPSTLPFLSQQPGPPDFLNAKSTYKPGLDKYDSLLPDNYLQLLPKMVKEAFESQKFEWGKVPEWIPPKELR